MIQFSELPPNLKFWHPTTLIATVCGVGLLPRAPGTWGSLAGLVTAFIVHVYFGTLGLVLATGLLFFLGWWAAQAYAVASGNHDPGAIVIDEVVGQWCVLIFISADIGYYIGAFALFRLTDILKPWPIGWFDRTVGGGFGIMFDDILAAIYAIIAVRILMWLTGTP